MSEINATDDVDTPETDDSQDEPTARRRTRWFVEWGLIIVLAVVIALGFRTYVAQTFFIPSSSMAPTLQIGDRIVVSKLSVTFGTIHTGDIVVFRAPSDVASNCDGVAETYLVKRVIGLPGEHLSNNGTTIYINGKKLHEWWHHTSTFGPRNIPQGEVVPKGQYYMIGDNNAASCDSRYWGPVKRSAIVGKVFLRIWPPSRIGFL